MKKYEHWFVIQFNGDNRDQHTQIAIQTNNKIIKKEHFMKVFEANNKEKLSKNYAIISYCCFEL